MSGIELRIYDWHTSGQTTEPQILDKSQSLHFRQVHGTPELDFYVYTELSFWEITYEVTVHVKEDWNLS